MSYKECGAQTTSGGTCKIRILQDQDLCWMHSGPQCSICFAPLTSRTSRTLPCNHTFHIRCIERWKRNCMPADPTCPMCRTQFDLPSYRCRLFIERVSDSNVQTIDYVTSNLQAMSQGLGINFPTLLPPTERFTSEIHFDIDPNEDLRTVLNELGILYNTLFEEQN